MRVYKFNRKAQAQNDEIDKTKNFCQGIETGLTDFICNRVAKRIRYRTMK